MITYKDAGVNIEEGYKAVKLMKEYTARTLTSSVLNGIGSFAGMMRLPAGYEKPVLVSGTDGVGTKIEIAIKLRKFDTIGIDCVAMCVNDILCHGAKPLFFLDYIACGKLDSIVASDIVKGVSEGCLQSYASLTGGETAEMPGMYNVGDYDLAGFAVGIVDEDKIIDGSDIKDGDVLIGLSSSGIHSNGYSLVRKLIKNYDEKLNGRTLGDILLEPTKIYVKPVLAVMEKFKLNGLAHITGGGFYENVPRMLPENAKAVIKKDSYPVPAIFDLIAKNGHIAEEMMYNTFNMGLGMVIAVDKDNVNLALEAIEKAGDKAYVVGHIEQGEKGVVLC